MTHPLSLDLAALPPDVARALPADLQDDLLTADVRILQRRRGHRYSIDDLVTAHEAVQAWRRTSATPPAYADLGCGIGSVLLLVGWALSPSRVMGIEAQPESHLLARANVLRAGWADNFTILEGDLRSLAPTLPARSFDLVTGTPPYLPVGTALASPDPQRAAARLELRGGVEAYLDAAAHLVTCEGAVVVCGDGRRPDRVEGHAPRVGLAVERRLDVFAAAEGPRGVRPLFSVWTLRRGARAPDAAAPFTTAALTARDATGAVTGELAAIRRAFQAPRGEPAR